MAVGPRLPGSVTPPLLHPIKTHSHEEQQHPIISKALVPWVTKQQPGCGDKVVTVDEVSRR